MIDVDLIKNSARQRKISLSDLASRIDYSEAGFHKALTNGTLRVEAIIRIAKVLDLSLDSFVKDEKILKLAKALSNTDDHEVISNGDRLIKNYVDRIRALNEGLNAYHQQMDMKDEQLSMKDQQLMKCLSAIEIKDNLIEELVKQNLEKDKAFKEAIKELKELLKSEYSKK
jgi:transcriptional regulator with XRE-family HTH domain